MTIEDLQGVDRVQRRAVEVPSVRTGPHTAILCHCETLDPNIEGRYYTQHNVKRISKFADPKRIMLGS